MENLSAMKTALRVLTAITERHIPDPTDLTFLRHYAPHLPDLSPDELACEVIQQALKRRAAQRSAASE